MSAAKPGIVHKVIDVADDVLVVIGLEAVCFDLLVLQVFFPLVELDNESFIGVLPSECEGISESAGSNGLTDLVQDLATHLHAFFFFVTHFNDELFLLI